MVCVIAYHKTKGRVYESDSVCECSGDTGLCVIAIYVLCVCMSNSCLMSHFTNQSWL